MRIPFLAGMLSVLLVLGVLSSSAAAPKPDLWPRWESHAPDSTVEVDHSPGKHFMSTYLDVDHPSGINRMRYGRVKAKDRQALDTYIRSLEATTVSALNREEQKAYWINLYNSLTVKVILDHYPVKSIRDIDISPGILSDGPWRAKLLLVEGEKVSLDDIEHRILRSIWKDNRVHYAVNCASIGCPNLQPEAFTASSTEGLLEKGAREYVNQSRGVRVEGGRLYLSSIYNWFEVDFGGSRKGVIEHIRWYADEVLSAALDKVGEKPSYGYDWTLNE